MVKQRKIDPNTIRMREAKTMKNALMSFLDALKTRGLLNSMYSMKDIESFLLYLREQSVASFVYGRFHDEKYILRMVARSEGVC